MGADAKFKVFVGIKFDSEDLDDILSKLPEEFFDEDSKLHWITRKINEIKDKYGFYLETFELEDIDESGLGVKVFSNDWDEMITPFDVGEVKNNIEGALDKVAKLFADCGISDTVDVFCFSDYS